MTSDPIRQFIAEHQRKLIAQFSTPCYDYFANRFGCDIPSHLKRLYNLRAGLCCHPFARECGLEAPLQIQNFAPMTQKAIDYCDRYDFQYYHFAAGPDGEGLLVPLDEDGMVHVDWDCDGENPEPAGLSFKTFVDRIISDPPERHVPGKDVG